MPFLVVGFPILALVASDAVNVGYHAFAAAMSVVNEVSGEPVVYSRPFMTVTPRLHPSR